MNRLLLAVIIEVLVLSSVSFGYSGGSGTPQAPYQISDANDLLELAAEPNDYNKCFILTADINMQSQVFTTAIIAPDTNSKGGFQGTSFTGTFDGSSHKTTNFTINGGSNDYLGLLGQVGSGGSIKNLGLENCNVNGLAGSSRYHLGGLTGDNHGSITNCYSTGNVTSESLFVGGLVGENSGGDISNCFTTGLISGRYYVAGLVGSNISDGNIRNCYSASVVTTSGALDSRYFGGLVGYNVQGNISNCYATGNVNGIEYVGGLVGYDLEGNIIDCYATGSTDGTSDVGGLVGYSGLVGGGTGGDGIISCYFLNTGGPNNGYGLPLSDVQMKQQDSFADWDFIEIWNIGENQTYPFLRVYLPSDIDYDGRTDFFDLAILASHWLQQD
jgi:hypothetical protein